MGEFLCEGLLADYLFIRLHGVAVWEYETIFNTKYFIINSKIIDLCSCNRTAVLTYTYIHTHTHTQVAVYWRGESTNTHTHTHLRFRVHKHTCISGGVSFYHFHYIHKHVGIYWKLVDESRHTYTHPRLITCTMCFNNLSSKKL